MDNEIKDATDALTHRLDILASMFTGSMIDKYYDFLQTKDSLLEEDIAVGYLVTLLCSQKYYRDAKVLINRHASLCGYSALWELLYQLGATNGDEGL